MKICKNLVFIENIGLGLHMDPWTWSPSNVLLGQRRWFKTGNEFNDVLTSPHSCTSTVAKDGDRRR